MNEELRKLLNTIIKEKGGGYKDYRLLMDKIGYHESKSDPKAVQMEDGPGRGKYQFEVGDNKGANTAVNRTYKYMKDNGIKIPQWLNKAYKNKSTDASQLKDYQQDIMFLGNMMGHPKADFKNVIDGKESTVDFWSKYHWAGKNKDLEARTKSFNDSMEHYKQPEPPKQVDLMQYLTKPSKEDPQIYPQEDPVNQFASGGKLNNNCGGPGQPPCDENYFEIIRNSRNGEVRKNTDGSVSTHLMADNNKDKAFPTLFRNQDGTWDDYSNNHDKAFERAIKENEIYTFPNQKELFKFAREGSWKNNKFNLGGQLNSNINQSEFNQFNEGGSHQQNPHGGIPMGTGPNGKMNTVEQGETSYEFEDGKYIFSARLGFDKKLQGQNVKPNQFANGGLMNYISKNNSLNKITNDINTDPDPDKKKVINDNNNLENIPFTASNLIKKYEKSNYKYGDIHDKSNSSCLAGALNCFTQSKDHQNFGFVSKELPGYPSMRSYIKDDKIKKYRKNDIDSKDINNFVPNTTIDAWEIHDYLRGENLGKALFKDTKFTYNKNNNIPDQILENPSLLPIGTIIGQGKVKNKMGYSKYKSSNPKTADSDNRHALVVIGYDEKDGMPIVYDYGEERRLNDVTWKSIGKADHYTVPNEYANLTYDNIKKRNIKQFTDLGFSKNKEENNISLNSSWKPIQSIEKGVNNHQKNIGTHYNINKSTLNKFAKLLPGLSYKETKLNNNDGTSDTIISDNWLSNSLLKPGIKSIKNLFSNDDDSKTKNGKQDWELEIEAYKKYPKDVDKRNKYFKDMRKSISKKEGKSRVESSVGAFKIKDLSTYMKKINKTKGDLYGVSVSNDEELELGAVAALSLLSEKYNKAKKIHPSLNEDQLIKLAIIGYSNNSKLESKKFVNFYIKNNYGLTDNNYNKIKNYTYNTKRK